MALFTIKDLSFTYALANKPALNALNFEINEGEFIVVCGSTGSGKSTLLKMMKKEISPIGKCEGSIEYNGSSLDNLAATKSASEIGFVMQNPSSQIIHDMVYSELAFGLENIGTKPEVIAVKIAEISSYFGINNWYQRKTSTLSGGEKQILNLASTLVMNPKVLLIDEPTAQLDPIAASDFLITLKKINEDFGITIILIEHRLDEVFSLADRVMFLNEGRILAFDNPKEVGKKIKDERLFLNLPSLFRLAKKLKLNEYPLTVKEAQNLISDFPKSSLELNIKEFQKKKEVFKIKNLYFKYERNQNDILEDLSLKIYESEIFSVVGSNGSGKTTLLKLIANLLKPYYGKIKLDSKNIDSYKESELYKNNLAYLPQDPKDILFAMTVEEELGLNNIEDEEILDLFKTLEINELVGKHPDDLSGGETQKLAIAKILLQKPKVILLDEPTKGLDPFLKTKLANILEELRLKGLTIIIVSHDIEFVARVSTRVGLLFSGKILAISDPRTFFSSNYYYTTIINKVAKTQYPNAIIEDDLVKLLKHNGVL